MNTSKRKRGRPRKAQQTTLPTTEATAVAETAEQPSSLLGNLKAGISNIVSHPQNQSEDSSLKSSDISQTPTDTAERERELAAIPDVVGEGNAPVDQAKPEERRPAQPIPIFAAVKISMGPLVERLTDEIAEKRGEHWRAKPEEVQNIAKPMEALLGRGLGWLMSLMPAGVQESVEKMPDVVQLGVAIGEYSVPRVFTDLTTSSEPKPQLVRRGPESGGHGRPRQRNEDRGIHASAEEYEEGVDL